MRILWFVVVAAIGTLESHGSRILILSPIAFKSHTIFYRGLAKAMIENGHEVTQVLPFNNSAASGAREIVLSVPNIHDLMASAFHYGTMGFIDFSSKHMADMCFQALTSDEFQEIRKEEFDVVLFAEWSSYCFHEYITTIKAPFIMIQAYGMEFAFIASYMGNPFFNSFVPNIFLDHSPSQDGLPFWQRLLGTSLHTLISVGDYFAMNYVVPNGLKDIGMCTSECPDVYTRRTDASLLIINSFKTLESAVQPHVPAIIHAGGLHLNKAKSLPHELEQWVAGAGEDGFILFSLGTVVKTSDMPEETRVMLLKVLGSLKQRILWKWDKDNMEDLPPNVKISKWLPQQDILSHSNLRIFITHGGLHSTQEAFYNGVPVLGLPVFADQSMNMAAVEKQGWGRVINWKGLTEEILKEALLDVINNQRYRTEAQRRQRISRDQLISPQETVNYWVDYVIRHNGARHLDSPIKWMPWYTLYNVDVWIVLIISLSFLLLNIFVFLSCIYDSCGWGAKKKTD